MPQSNGHTAFRILVGVLSAFCAIAAFGIAGRALPLQGFVETSLVVIFLVSGWFAIFAKPESRQAAIEILDDVAESFRDNWWF